MTTISVEMIGVVAICVRILLRVMMKFMDFDHHSRHRRFINIGDLEEATS